MIKQDSDRNETPYTAMSLLTAAVIFFIILFPQQKIYCGDNFEIVEQGKDSGYAEKKILVIRNREEWQKIWNIHAGIRLPTPELPEIDFSRWMIIAVFSGGHSSGGYTIKIDGIERNADKISVKIIEVKPKRGDITIQSFTCPYQIVRIEATDLPVEVIEK